MWRQVVELAVGRGLDALIDCGALLAGTTNRCVGASSLSVRVRWW